MISNSELVLPARLQPEGCESDEHSCRRREPRQAFADAGRDRPPNAAVDFVNTSYSRRASRRARPECQDDARSAAARNLRQWAERCAGIRRTRIDTVVPASVHCSHRRLDRRAKFAASAQRRGVPLP